MADDTNTGPLVVHSEFATTDIDEAEDLIRRGYAADSKLTVHGIADEFTFSHSAVIAPGFSLTWPRFGISLTDEAVTGPGDPLVVVQPTGSRIAYVDTRYPGDAYAETGDVVLFPPDGPLRVISERFDAAMVQFDRSAVTAHAAATTGLDPAELAFGTLTPRTAALGRYWADTVAHVRDQVLANPWAAASPIALDQAFQTLTTALLGTFPNTAFARTTDPEAPPVRGAVSTTTTREVLDYLDTHADQPINPNDLAELSGTPRRDHRRAPPSPRHPPRPDPLESPPARSPA